jgi:RimJ/RimL family protein N-acetyltransferase
MFESLTEGNLTLRPFEAADRDVLIAGRDEEFDRFLADASPEPAPFACIRVDGVLVGWVDYDQDDRHWLDDDDEANLGYSVFPEHRGKGYATRALRLLCFYLAALDAPLRPTLLIHPDNAPSLAVAGTAGFVQIGEVDGELLFRS